MGREDDITAKIRRAKFVLAAARCRFTTIISLLLHSCKFLEYFLKAALGLFAVMNLNNTARVGL